MKITILHADVTAESGKDEQDVLVQTEAVRESLLELGHEVSLLPVTLDLHKAEAHLAGTKPDTVFNLVESLSGTGRFIHFAPSLLEHLSIPFTGAGSESLYLTTGKMLAGELKPSIQGNCHTGLDGWVPCIRFPFGFPCPLHH